MTSRRQPARPQTVTFEFTKSPYFRVVHSNGAWGGVSPHGEMSVTFYSERHAYPRSVVHELSSTGKLGAEKSRKGQSSLERELEVEVIMGMDEAVTLHGWLGSKIDEWQKLELPPASKDAGDR